MVLDLDQELTNGGLEVDWEPLQYPHKGEAMAWIVINPSAMGIPTTNWWDEPNGWGAPEGEQYFMSVCSESGAADDWLISDELTGEAQTITFQQRGYYGYETFQVLYSTTDMAPESFVSVLETNTASYYWTAVSVDLPAGARYFAIRNMGGPWAQYMLVDDIHYESQASKGGLQLQGYRIYRDREAIAETTETSYVDQEVTVGTHIYDVTALYNLGESCPATAIADVVTELNSLAADRQVVILYSIDGRQMNSNAKGFGIAIDHQGNAHKEVRK